VLIHAALQNLILPLLRFCWPDWLWGDRFATCFTCWIWRQIAGYEPSGKTWHGVKTPYGKRQVSHLLCQYQWAPVLEAVEAQ